jgi:hypothetical protein
MPHIIGKHFCFEINHQLRDKFRFFDSPPISAEC